MTKFSKILLGVWMVLAIICFITCFWLPLFPQITGIAFGILNMIIILSLGITYLQGMYWKNKRQKELEDYVQLQKDEAEATAETSGDE